MTDKTKKSKLKYSVILDTNTLVYGNPLRSELTKLIHDFKDHEEVELGYFIPKVVEEEFKSKIPSQILNAKKKYRQVTKEIDGLMGTTLSDSEPVFSENDLKQAAQKILEGYRIQTLDTPGIGVASLIEKAVHHRPPFSAGEGDAGFKDSVIAETIKHHTPGLSNESRVVVICSDHNFREYLEGISEEFKFKVYQSVEEFESDLKLHLLLSGEESRLANSLAKEAELIFYKDEDKSTLFYKEAWDRLNRTFPTLFSNPQPDSVYSGYAYMDTLSSMGVGADNSTQWIPLDKAKYEIFKPLFLKKSGLDTLIWESTIFYSQTFEKKIPPRGYSSGGSYIIGSLGVGTYDLKFTIKWSVKITGEGKLNPNTAKVVDVDQVKNSPSATVTVSFSPTSISGPTTLSGTVTSPSLSPSASASPSASEDLDEDNS